jgi:transcriptional regulator with XRE-family HTH domain
MNKEKVSIGSRIRIMREAKGIKQEEVAELTGISQQMYSKYENDTSKLTVEKLEKIAEALGMESGELLSSEGSYTFNIMHNDTGNGVVIHQTAPNPHDTKYINMLEEKIRRLELQLQKL